MLREPQLDEARLAADRAVLQAIQARVELGAHDGPDAEALALRRLLDGVTREEAAVLRAVWGRMTPDRSLVIWGGAAQVLAADRFGVAGRLAAEPEAALKAASEGAWAVLDVQPRPWWARLLAQPNLRVVGCLPDDRHLKPQVLIVSTGQPGPTGEDRTFWVTDSALPDAGVVGALGQAGLAAQPLSSSGGLKLFALSGYVQAEDGRLTDAPGRLHGVIGAAPLF